MLSAAAGLRLTDPTNAQEFATLVNLGRIAIRACNVDVEGTQVQDGDRRLQDRPDDPAADG